MLLRINLVKFSSTIKSLGSILFASTQLSIKLIQEYFFHQIVGQFPVHPEGKLVDYWELAYCVLWTNFLKYEMLYQFLIYFLV